MDRVPSNHRLAERQLIVLVRDGEWEIRIDGSIWRVGRSRSGPSRFGRVEKRLPSGYLMVRAMRGGARIVGLAHRLVWQHVNGDIPPGMTINHVNGLKDDNRPENLVLSSCREQIRHAHRSGLLDQHGQNNPAAKLTNNQVAQIRNAYAGGGHTMKELAMRFGVTFQTISKIVRGKRRPKQGGPVAEHDQRRCTSERDPVTGRFGKKATGHLLDGREWREFPVIGGGV